MYVFHITLRFQILEHELSMVGDFTSVYDTNEKQHQLIIRCAKIHSETLKWALDIFLHNEYQNFPLNQVRSPLFELVLTRVLFRLALGLCRHLHFLLSHTAGNIFFEIDDHPVRTNISQVVFASSSFMFIAGIIQSFMFSNCGQIVCNASESCSRAIYSTYWNALSRIDQRKIVLFMLTQSQANIGFTAGGFPVSLELFMKVKCINGFIKNYFYLNVFFCLFYL